MSSVWGNTIKISLFGEAHGPVVGGTMHDFPAGIPLNLDRIKMALKLRQGNNNFTAVRKKEDRFEILSGITKNVTNGAPITVIFTNPDRDKVDYNKDLPRPSQADYAAQMRYRDSADMNGGGHLSSRPTLPLVFFGMMCADYLKSTGIDVVSHIKCIGNVYDEPFGAELSSDLISRLNSAVLPAISSEARKKMVSLLMSVKAMGDSLGGSIETAVVGLPAGIGSPIMDTLEGKIASLLFAVPGVKSVGFGLGHMFGHSRGSEVADAFERAVDGKLRTSTNYNGGINGGISNGMPVLVTCGIKPNPSFQKVQRTLNLETNQIVDLRLNGDYPVSVVPRSAIIATSAVAIAVMDAYFEGIGYVER